MGGINGQLKSDSTLSRRLEELLDLRPAPIDEQFNSRDET